MTDPRFSIGLRTSLLSRLLPDWTARAACASKTLPGQPWDSAFADEVTGSLDVETHRWPERVRQVMATCAGCPVRSECLAYAFEREQHLSQDWMSGEMYNDSFRSGIFGGVPGPAREHFAASVDPIAASEAWFARQMGEPMKLEDVG